jgi:tRNA A-37 threonylcarbamoyl transferase component Bud32
MQLDQEFVSRWRITKYICEKQFASKRNDVYLVSAVCDGSGTQRFVVKEYREQADTVTKEAFLLKALYTKGVSVPRLYYKGNRCIVVEHINGTPLLDVMTDAEYFARESMDYINLKGIATHVARWLDGFYKAIAEITGRDTILWDINLRNFLVGYKLYGIDFEDCREGAIEEDIGRLIAFSITYEPAFTQYKMKFAKGIYDAMGELRPLNRDKVMNEVIKELDAIRERRDIVIPQDIEYRILLWEQTE